MAFLGIWKTEAEKRAELYQEIRDVASMVGAIAVAGTAVYGLGKMLVSDGRRAAPVLPEHNADEVVDVDAEIETKRVAPRRRRSA